MWPLETYQRVMSYKDKPNLSSAAVERITGVHKRTVNGWWNGRRPWIEYREIVSPPPRPRVIPPDPESKAGRLIRRKRRRQWREAKTRQRYRRDGIFHSTWNPDPAVAPLSRLWVSAGHLLALIDEEVGRQEANRILEDVRSWREIRLGKKAWLRFDAADRILTALEISTSRLPDPIYSVATPKENPCP